MRRLSLALLSLSLLAPAAAAQPVLEDTPDLVLFELRDDVYAVGETITLEAASRGDVFAVGGTVRIDKAVGADLAAAGGTIVIENGVRDDVRVAGGEITINGPVGGDILVFGGTVVIGPKAIVAGDVFVAGGKISIEGRIRGNLKAKGSQVSLVGSVDGAADIRTERLTLSGPIRRGAILAARQWYIGDDARINGPLRYWQPQGEREFTNVALGPVTYDATLAMQDSEKVTASTIGMLVAAVTAFSLFSGVLTIAVLMLITKHFFRDTAKRLRAAPGKSFLLGLLYFLLTPIVVLLLFATIIGIPIGLLLLACYVFSIVFAKSLTAIVLAKWVEITYQKPLHGAVSFLLAIVIFLILKLLFIIPFLGWLACLIAVCMAFGALVVTKYERFLKIR